MPTLRRQLKKAADGSTLRGEDWSAATIGYVRAGGSAIGEVSRCKRRATTLLRLAATCGGGTRLASAGRRVRTPIDPQTPASPSLSVITPAYNVERYLPRCIESVLGQTWQDLELVVVDDGSTDRTADVISDYAAQDSRVRGFRGRNRGVSYARNVAMKHARGRYFGFIDGDDEWEPTFASTLIGVLEREPQVAVVTGNALNAGGGALDGRPVRPWPATLAISASWT